MMTEVQDKAYEFYKRKPTRGNRLKLVQLYQREIDNAVNGMVGGQASRVVRRRAYVLAAQAVKTYDPSMGVPLKNHILVNLQPLHRMARQIHEPISIPERHRRYRALLDQAREELWAKYDREPTDEELADHTGLSVRQQKRVSDLERGMFSESSFAQAGQTDEGPGEMPGKAVDPMKEWEDYVYHDLDPIDKKIYDARIKGTGTGDLATKLNVTPGAVSQRLAKIENRILRGPS